jgi:hypothetical protein
MLDQWKPQEIQQEYIEALYDATYKTVERLYNQVWAAIDLEAANNHFPLNDTKDLIEDVIRMITERLVNTGTQTGPEPWLSIVADEFVDMLSPVLSNLKQALLPPQWVVIQVKEGKAEVVQKTSGIHVQIVDFDHLPTPLEVDAAFQINPGPSIEDIRQWMLEQIVPKEMA